jgi:hypothetical protein
MLVLMCVFYSVNPLHIYPFIPTLFYILCPYIFTTILIPLYPSYIYNLISCYFILYPYLIFYFAMHFFTCIFSNFAVHLAILPLKYNLKNIYPYLIVVYTRSHNFVFIFIHRAKNKTHKFYVL